MKFTLNIAVGLTLFRLFSLPAFAYLALSDNSVLQFVSAILFGLAALTDWLDGYFARRLNQVSEFGAVLDPLVDRIFLITSLIVLYFKVSEFVPLWSVAVIAGRDAVMMAGWLFFRTLRGTSVTVTYAGKVSTALLMISLFLLLASESLDIEIIEYLGVIIFYGGLFLSVVTGVQYAISAISGIGEDRLVNDNYKNQE